MLTGGSVAYEIRTPSQARRMTTTAAQAALSRKGVAKAILSGRTDDVVDLAKGALTT